MRVCRDTIRKVKMKTEIRLLRWGQLPAEVGRRINTNKEKDKTLKKKRGRRRFSNSTLVTSGICTREQQRLTLFSSGLMPI